jgi:hypothetical protein
LSVAVLAVAGPYVDRYQESPHFARRISQVSGAAAPAVGSFRHFRPSYVYYTAGPVAQLHSADEVAAFFDSHPRAAFVITNDAQYESLRANLPTDVVVLESRRRLQGKGQALLLGRSQQQAANDSSRTRH